MWADSAQDEAGTAWVRDGLPLGRNVERARRSHPEGRRFAVRGLDPSSRQTSGSGSRLESAVRPPQREAVPARAHGQGGEVLQQVRPGTGGGAGVTLRRQGRGLRDTRRSVRGGGAPEAAVSEGSPGQSDPGDPIQRANAPRPSVLERPRCWTGPAPGGSNEATARGWRRGRS